ncbi:MAG: hypothetical protein J1G01_00155 [Clostridiales bacterium]|nr:hypothetical protein [Clostridiales bacterium]
MDKTTRALSVAEDNSNDIAALKAHTRTFVLFGEQTETGVSLGRLSVTGECSVVITFEGGYSLLKFCDQVIDSGLSMIILSLPHGRGELELVGDCTNGRALVIGAKKV